MAHAPTHQDLNGILDQLRDGRALLFLGAGSSRFCRNTAGKRGLTGQELAEEILKELNNGVTPPFSTNLMQASEYWVASKPSTRAGLDKFVRDRLTDLQPTLGHYIAAAFPWAGVVTTNYNSVAEDAWGTAHASGWAARQFVAIRNDVDLKTHGGNATHMRIYKPHGCITVQQEPDKRMVLTSADYYLSQQLRPGIYEAVGTLVRTCSTLFMGYSLADYTFRNIFYQLRSTEGEWQAKSYSIAPVGTDLEYGFLRDAMRENFKTTVIDDSFDAFMVRLLMAAGKVPPGLKVVIQSRWATFEADNAAFATGITLGDVLGLPDGMPLR